MAIKAGTKSITVSKNPCGGQQRTLTLSAVPEVGGEHFVFIQFTSGPYVTWGWRYAKDGPDGAYTSIGNSSASFTFSSANEIYELMPYYQFDPPEGVGDSFKIEMPYSVGAPYAPSWAQLEGTIEVSLDTGAASLPNIRFVDMQRDICADAAVDISCETFTRLGAYLECNDTCTNQITGIILNGEIRTRTLDAFGNTTCTVMPAAPYPMARYANDGSTTKKFVCASTTGNGNKLTSIDNPIWFVALPPVTYVVTSIGVSTSSGSQVFEVEIEAGNMQAVSLSLLPEGSGACIQNPALDPEPDWDSLPPWGSASYSAASGGMSLVVSPNTPYEQLYDERAWYFATYGVPFPEEGILLGTIIPNGYVGLKYYSAKIDYTGSTSDSYSVVNGTATGGCWYRCIKECGSQELKIYRGPILNNVNISPTTWQDAYDYNAENPYPGVTSQTTTVIPVPGMGEHGGIQIISGRQTWCGPDGAAINYNAGGIDAISLIGKA